MTFQQCFEITTCQKKVWAHFDGTSPCPTSAVLTAPTQAKQAVINTWQEHRRKGTTTAIWNAISQEFIQKSMLLRMNLWMQLLNMRYMPSTNLHTELDHLWVKYEELMMMDILVSNAEYTSLIINFLPDDMSTFVSQISATVKLAHCFQNASITLAPPATANMNVPAEEPPILDAEALIKIVLEKWDHRQTGKVKTRPKDAGIAASLLSSEKPRGKGRGHGPQKPVGMCWNCRGKGHHIDQCPSPKQDSAKPVQFANGKADQPKPSANTVKPKAGSANTATSTAASTTLDAITSAWSTYIAFDLDVSTKEALPVFDSADTDTYSDCTELTEVSAVSGDSLPSLQTMSGSTASAVDDLLDEVSSETAPNPGAPAVPYGMATVSLLATRT
ncbi:hypothetical protein IEO21_10399 [Rhodonia placenta]|uniref:CCHC-type domain-containing protein n=1 Tax=Rhodonia placenta TaxID=104341 RepID=A0A8H7NSG3_9APHY|nr:hypothetical protein IEO21_10399 [Postia placenta]